MKVSIKTLSLLLILLDGFLLFGEVPLQVLVFSLSLLIISFFVQHKNTRLFLKIVFLFSSMVMLKFLFKPLLVTEAGVAFVLILAALKFWELENDNDYFNMFLILALLECSLFLLVPIFTIFILGVFKIVVFFYYILKIRNYDLSQLSIRRLITLVVPSLIFSLLLFYTFPRFTQGFLNTTGNPLTITGNDNKISFKNLGPLSTSSKVAFRVFGLDKYKLPYPNLYWRTSVLWDYYKDNWQTGYINFKSPQVTPVPPVFSYTVQLTQDYNEFLPSLDGISRIDKINQDFNYYNEGSFRLKNISKTIVQYEVETDVNNLSATNLPLMMRKGLKLKSERKEEIKKLILKNKNENEISSSEKLKLVLDFFKAKNYSYSLNPKPYLSIEDFILNGTTGYCSHFSASFAFMARSVGLQSRIISGYQGGEYNPYDHSIIVRELDAHAWVEVYLENQGWIKIDPTSMVAPERITLGSIAFHEKLEPNFNLLMFKIPKNIFKLQSVDQLALWLDSLNSNFNNAILYFDKDKQQEILNYFSIKKISIGWTFVGITIFFMAFFWCLLTFTGREKIDPRAKRYRKFLRKMSSMGHAKKSDETISAFRERLLQKNLGMDDYITKETNYYIDVFYKS